MEGRVGWRAGRMGVNERVDEVKCKLQAQMGVTVKRWMGVNQMYA